MRSHPLYQQIKRAIANGTTSLDVISDATDAEVNKAASVDLTVLTKAERVNLRRTLKADAVVAQQEKHKEFVFEQLTGRNRRAFSQQFPKAEIEFKKMPANRRTPEAPAIVIWLDGKPQEPELDNG